MAWYLVRFLPRRKKSSRSLLSETHDVRATLDCGPPRLLRDWDSALTVRRPKPLIPLTTAPHRVSDNSMSSFPAATMTRAARTTPNASTGAVIAITASETTSFVVKAFMRSFCNTCSTFFATRPLPRDESLLNKRRATNPETNNVKVKRHSSGWLTAGVVPSG